MLTITIIRNIDEVEVDLLKDSKDSTLYKGVRLVEKSGQETPFSKFNNINTKYILDLRIVDRSNYIKPTKIDSHPYQLFIYEMGELIHHQRKREGVFENFTFHFVKLINV